jgi:Flp pilus assembly pilin Flp
VLLACGWTLLFDIERNSHVILWYPLSVHGGANMADFLRNLWWQEEGQDIAEYAVMLAVILVLVVGTIRLIGTSANNVFSATASSIGQ